MFGGMNEANAEKPTIIQTTPKISESMNIATKRGPNHARSNCCNPSASATPVPQFVALTVKQR
jgi:hypothetical protein